MFRVSFFLGGGFWVRIPWRGGLLFEDMLEASKKQLVLVEGIFLIFFEAFKKQPLLEHRHVRRV